MKTICANCEHNDGNVYTSNPPMYKCTITGEFYHGFHECEVEFAPVKHGRWLFDEYGWACSVCDYQISRRYGKYNYCPHCGARMMDEVEE